MMELVTFSVSKLFGYFDHTIHLKRDEKITIITAPNGYGKTVILRMLNAIFSGEFNYIEQTLVDEVTLVFADGKTLLFTKNNVEGQIEMEIRRISKNGKVDKYPYSKEFARLLIDPNSPLVKALNRLPWLRSRGPNEWLDEETGDSLTGQESIKKYSDSLDPEVTQPILPKWLRDYKENIDVRLIEDQRLIQRNEVTGRGRYRYSRGYDTRRVSKVNTIEQYADELHDKINDLASKYSANAQKLDSSFPGRLLDPQPDSLPLPKESTLKKHLEEIELKRQTLMGYGLIEDDPGSRITEQINEKNFQALSLYVDDTRKKYSVYDDILEQLKLFTSILNNKRLSFKNVCIDKKHGFCFKTVSDADLDLVALSSGEQHEVVLLYDLIFKTDSNSLVLIDEPEISLHIVWQDEFLNDLRKIQDLQSLSAIISTHSPQIIGNDWDLVVNLEEEVN